MTSTVVPISTQSAPSPAIADVPAVEATVTEQTITQVRVSVDTSCSQFNAPGDDNNAKEEEYVCFWNEGDGQVDLTGWVLHDDYGWSFVFPSFSLGSEDRVRVRTGCGTNTKKDLYWCKDGTAVWNNGGDCVYLSNANGDLTNQYCY